MAKKKSSGQTRERAPARARGGFKSSRHGTGKRASPAGPKAAQKQAAEEREAAGAAHTTAEQSRFLRGGKIDPRRIDGRETVVDLVEGTFLAYNAARLREACQLFTQKMLEADVTVGMTLTGALTPAGLGMAAIIPLIESGFVDWIISTGANLYHDTHFGLGLTMHRGNAQESDVVLREEGVVRIYDIFFDYDVLLSTDAFFRKIIQGREFQRSMSSAEFHYLCGKYVREREKALGHRAEVAAVGGVRGRSADLHVVAGRFVHRHERRGAGAGGEPVRDRSQSRRQRDGVDRARGQTRRREVGGLHLRRRQPQELHAADRAADPGSAGHRREGPRLSSCRSPMRGPTPADCPAPRRPRR